MGIPLMTNSVLAGTDSILALIRNRVATIFGKNASNVMYYTSCHVNNLAIPSSWSVPVPVLSGIERITSYINLKDGGDTVFAAGGTKFRSSPKLPVLQTNFGRHSPSPSQQTLKRRRYRSNRILVQSKLKVMMSSPQQEPKLFSQLRHERPSTLMASTTSSRTFQSLCP